MMTEEAKEARRRYRRAWNKANPDKVKAATERYWQKKAEEAAKAEESNEAENNVTIKGAAPLADGGR